MKSDKCDILQYENNFARFAPRKNQDCFVQYHKNMCHDCTTILHAVKILRRRVGATMVSRTVHIFEKKDVSHTKKTYHVSRVA
jgi:hypothetical protein